MQGRQRVQQGMALIMVLWVIALLTVMALGLTMSQRTAGALARNQLDDARFRALADAAISLAAFNLLSTPIELNPVVGVWIPDGTPRELLVGDSVLTLTLSNEASRLDLNAISSDQLRSLIELTQDDRAAEPLQVDALADAIMDWRDGDSLTLPNGAEDADYDAAALPHGAGDAPFNGIEELRQVLGMTNETYRRLAADLTVDNAAGGGTDLEFASATVLAVVRGIPLEDARREIDQRRSPASPDGRLAAPVGRGGPVYRLAVSWAEDRAVVRHMEAVFEITPGSTPPFSIFWRRYGLTTVQ
ncbi:general secretion pathway protein GspK [Thiohalocapsa marina]|uniref:General secretion pathway protein GspK n=1 Tax=Thiohalocapsa marina TaxID=424902 RepID=A0A5M8FU01_9GAMM|nr:type II secretion system protein GspK [Thiohalocapsa marina]KAA6187288.1 general secretion pathway protein GspK [Thiohalocapsa marina]